MDDVEWTRQAFEQGKDLNFVVTEFVKKGYDEQQIDSIISKAREASKPQSSITPELVTPTPVVVLPETQNPIASAKQKPIKKYLIIAVILIIFIAAGYFFFFYMPQAAAIEESVKVADKFKNTTNGNLDESILKMKYFKGEITKLPEGVYACTNLELCQFSLDTANETNVVISWWADKILENPKEHNLDAVVGLSYIFRLSPSK